MRKNTGNEFVLNVLCLEDNLKDAELLQEMLVDAGYRVNMNVAAQEKEYISFLKSGSYHIILADYTLPGFNGTTALKLAQQLQPEVPFICVSGTIGEDIAVELLKQGATDYVLKDRLGRLAFAVKRALEGVEQRKERNKADGEKFELVHSLEVHQVELELQNEELIQSRGQAATASEKYIDLYDFAPSGYFTLSPTGNIIGLNLTGAKMLGKDRLQIKNRLFHLFITDDSKPILRLFLKKIFSSNTNESCELTLLTNGNTPLYVYLTGIVAENGNQCFMTATNITDRKQAESELRISNEFNQLLLKTIPFRMDIVDENGNVLYLSEGLEQHFGAGALGKKCWELYSDDHKQCDDCPLHAGIKVGLSGMYEATGVMGGKIFEVSHTGMIYNGQKAMLEIFLDITERKRTEEELLNKDSLLNITGHTAKVGGWEFDTETLKQTWTKEVYLIHEVDFTFVPDVNNGINFYAPQSRPIIEKAVQRATEYGEPFDLELEFVTNKGKHLWVHSIGEAHQINGVTKKVYGSFQDITERKQTEQKLRKLSHAVEQSPTSILLTDLDGKIDYANPKVREITGYGLDELIGQNPSILSSGETSKSDYKVLWETIQSGKVWHGEFHNKKKNGEFYWELASISGIIDEKGKITHYLAINEDITERKQVEQELIIAKEHAEESDRLKSAFLANMSHEIRTPMNGILGFAELLTEPELESEKQLEYIQIIQRSGVRMLNIINDIVDISKIESGLIEVKLAESNINEQIEFIYTFFKPEVEKKGIQLSFRNSLPAKEAILKTDREKLYAILTNLIKNAIKYTNEGSIEFGCEVVETRHALSLLKFYVKDTGIGIPLDRQEAIFERFIQADFTDKMARQGAGLGLAIAKAYVEMLGGKIWVESKEGIGSTFYFTLPYNAEPEEKKVVGNIVQPQEEMIQIKNLKILIAEDDESSSRLISIAVQKFGKEIIKVQTGTAAIEACRSHSDIDLILMDIQMPEMDGYEATRHIRQFNPGVVIIAQTAYALTGDKEKALEAGCTDYIQKPIRKDEFMKIMQKYFKK